MTTPAYLPTGSHLLADLYGVAADKLDQPDAIETLLLQSAQAAGAHVLYSRFHTFGPGLGVTGVVLLAESHISIHTWPEFGFAAADIFMCGSGAPERALDLMRDALAPERCVLRTVLRGNSLESRKDEVASPPYVLPQH